MESGMFGAEDGLEIEGLLIKKKKTEKEKT